MPAVIMGGWYRATQEFIEALAELGTATFACARNDLHEIHELLDMGAVGVRTQFITPDMLRMTEEEIEQKELAELIANNHNAFTAFVENLSSQLPENHIRIINVGNFYSIPKTYEVGIDAQYDAYDEVDAEIYNAETITSDHVNTHYVPEAVLCAFLTLVNLESEPITYITHNRYLFIDGYQYNHRIDDNVITIITYDQAARQIVDGVIFDPHNNFARTDIDLQWENNRRYFIEYLNNLNNMLHEGLMVFMSVNGDASEGLDKEMLEALASLGLTESLYGRSGYSYIAVIDGHAVIHEELSNEPLEYVEFLYRWLFGVSSAGVPLRNSSIRINREEHSQNAYGINIVVFNKNTGMVEDSIAFGITQNMLYITREPGV